MHGSSLKATRKLLSARYADVVLWRQRHGLANATRFQHYAGFKPRRELAVVIDGAALYHVVDHAELRRLFLSIAVPTRDI